MTTARDTAIHSGATVSPQTLRGRTLFSIVSSERGRNQCVLCCDIFLFIFVFSFIHFFTISANGRVRERTSDTAIRTTIAQRPHAFVRYYCADTVRRWVRWSRAQKRSRLRQVVRVYFFFYFCKKSGRPYRDTVQLQYYNAHMYTHTLTRKLDCFS